MYFAPRMRWFVGVAANASGASRFRPFHLSLKLADAGSLLTGTAQEYRRNVGDLLHQFPCVADIARHAAVVNVELCDFNEPRAMVEIERFSHGL